MINTQPSRTKTNQVRRTSLTKKRTKIKLIKKTDKINTKKVIEKKTEDLTNKSHRGFKRYLTRRQRKNGVTRRNNK